MKNWPAAILALLAGETEYLFAHLYTVTLASGAQDTFTDLDMDVTYNGVAYKSLGLRFEGVRMKLAVGTEVDEQDVKILALAGDTLAGGNFLAGVPQGLLDGAWLKRDRIFWPLVTGSTWMDIVSPATGWPLAGELSYMRFSTVTKAGRSHVEVKLKSPLELLQTQLPRRYYMAACGWKLYQPLDADGGGCGMVMQNFGVGYKVASAGLAPTQIPAAFTPVVAWQGFNYPGDPGAGAGGVEITAGFTNGVLSALTNQGVSNDSAPTFQRDRLVFTAGALMGEEILVGNNDGQNFFPAYPLSTLPSPGDTFVAYAGCLRGVLNCGLKFGPDQTGGKYNQVTGQAYGGNLAHFGGFDLVPSEHIGL